MEKGEAAKKYAQTDGISYTPDFPALFGKEYPFKCKFVFSVIFKHFIKPWKEQNQNEEHGRKAEGKMSLIAIYVQIPQTPVFMGCFSYKNGIIP
jgi:hypothetical protein